MLEIIEIVPSFDPDIVVDLTDCDCKISSRWWKPAKLSKCWRRSFVIHTDVGPNDNGPWVMDDYIIKPSRSYVSSVHSLHIEYAIEKIHNNEFSTDVRLEFPSFNECTKRFDTGRMGGHLPTAVADFYLLEAMNYLAPFAPVSNSIGFRAGGAAIDLFSPVLNRLASVDRSDIKEELAFQALSLYGETLEELFEAFYGYHYYACGKELRHHGPFSHILSSNSAVAYGVLMKMAQLVGAEMVNKWIWEAFSKDSWSRGFGGPAWAMCANQALAYSRGQLTKAQYIDRVWTLEHNSGAYLNKAAWDTRGDLYHVLQAHNESDFNTLYLHASKEVRELFYQMEKVFN